MSKTIRTILLIFVLASVAIFHCGKKQDKTTQGKPSGGTIVVVVPGDIDSFNPIVAAEQTAADVNDAIFPLLTSSKFNTETGILEYLPLLARSWEFANDHRDVIYHLKGDAYWQDGVKITGQDVKFSSNSMLILTWRVFNRICWENYFVRRMERWTLRRVWKCQTIVRSSFTFNVPIRCRCFILD